MERLTKLCVKDLYILRDYLSANYDDFDRDWVLDQLDIAIQKVNSIREIAKTKNARNKSLEGEFDWI